MLAQWLKRFTGRRQVGVAGSIPSACRSEISFLRLELDERSSIIEDLDMFVVRSCYFLKKSHTHQSRD